MVWNADGDGFGGRYGWRECPLFWDDAGQRSGPEARGKTESHFWDVVRNFIQIAHISDQNGNGFFERTVFGGVDTFDGGVVECECADTVNGVCWEGDDAALF